MAWVLFEKSAKAYENNYHFPKEDKVQKSTIAFLQNDIPPCKVLKKNSSPSSSASTDRTTERNFRNSNSNTNDVSNVQSMSQWLKTKPNLWAVMKSTLITRSDPDMIPRSKIAAFDFDGTISLHNGYISASSVSQYRVFNDRVVSTMQRLYHEGYALVIMSNQKGIGKAIDGKKASTVKGAMDMIIQQIGVPMDACLSLANDDYRKPSFGMWKGVLRDKGGKAMVDIVDCFYVGDAAGRPGDHADSDSQFAHNAGLRFLTPEECFSNTNPHIVAGDHHREEESVEQNKVLANQISAAVPKAAAKNGPKVPIVLILIGLPGSGKSSFAQKLLERCQRKRIWDIVSQDVLGSRQKCEKAVAAGLACGRSIIVDRTNLTIDQRESFIALAKTVPRNRTILGCQLHALIFSIPLDACGTRILGRRNHPSKVQGIPGLKVLETMKNSLIELPSTSSSSLSRSNLESFDVVSQVHDVQGVQQALIAYSSGLE